MLWPFAKRNHFLESQQHAMDVAHHLTFPMRCLVVREVLLHKDTMMSEMFLVASQPLRGARSSVDQ